jgi:hypothetical protein
MMGGQMVNYIQRFAEYQIVLSMGIELGWGKE